MERQSERSVKPSPYSAVKSRDTVAQVCVRLRFSLQLPLCGQHHFAGLVTQRTFDRDRVAAEVLVPENAADGSACSYAYLLKHVADESSFGICSSHCVSFDCLFDFDENLLRNGLVGEAGRQRSNGL